MSPARKDMKAITQPTMAPARALTGKPFGVNLITMHPGLFDLIAVCAKHHIGHVVLAGGIPPKGSIEAQSTSNNTLPQNARVVASNAMFLQLGAFSDQAKAQTLAAKVTQQLPAHVDAPVIVDRSASNLYRVRIGPFASRNAAVQAVSPVSSATGMTPSLSLP